MSGTEELKADSWFEKDYQIVREYLQSVGLSSIKYNPQAEFILELNYESILKLDQQLCFAYAYELHKYAIFLQKEENFLKGKLSWAEHKMYTLYGKEARSYGDKYTQYEERKAMVASDNAYGIELQKMIINVKIKLNSIYNLSKEIQALAKILEGLAYGKKNN